MEKGSFPALTLGAIGVILLLLNLMVSGYEPVSQLALGFILFSITLAIVGRRD